MPRAYVDQAVKTTSYQIELLAYHIGVIMRDSGTFGLACDRGHVEVTIARGPIGGPCDPPMDHVWDHVTIAGHSCGNRCGGARAYARFFAGVAEWWKP